MTDLTPKQEKAIAALMGTATAKDAAQAVGVAEWTLTRWLRDAAFATAYRDARRAAVNQAIGRVQQGATIAVDTLTEVMQDDAAPAGARVSAARVMLDMAVKGVELEDLQVRIEALESATPTAGTRNGR